MKRTIRLISVLLMLAMVLALLPVSAFAAKENFVVNSVAVTGIDAPVAGKAPDTTATSDRSDCSITHVGWMEYSANGSMVGEMEAGDTFRHGYMYAVLVTVTLTSNRKFSSPTCTINGGSTELVLSQDQKLVAMYTFAPLPQAISSVALTVVAPADGKTPTFAKISTTEYESKNYIEKISNQSNGCVWTNTGTNVNLSVNNPFDASKTYAVTYTLSPKDGFTFTDSTTATINGKKATVKLLNGFLFVNLTGLKPTAKETDITSVALTVVKPVAGKTPTFAKIDTLEYESKNYIEKISNQSNGCVWTNTATNVNLSVSNPFKADNTYSVTYTLYPKSGYKFTSSTTATINGQKATVRLIEGYLFVMLTGLKPTVPVTTISKTELTITAPAVGQKPSFTQITGTGFASENGGNNAAVYKNGIAWRDVTGSKNMTPGSTAVFEDGHEYTATIVLVAKDGYKFDKSTSATVNGKKATVEWVRDECVNVKITFKLDHVHKASDWKSDTNNHWKECTSCAQIMEVKAAHTDKNTDGKCDICKAKVPVKTEDPTIKPTEPTVKPTEPTEDPTEPTVEPTEPTVEPTEPTEEPTEPTEEPSEAPSQDEDPTTAPTTAEKDDDSDKDGKKGNNLVLIIILSVVAFAAIAGCVVLLIVKKKK